MGSDNTSRSPRGNCPRGVNLLWLLAALAACDGKPPCKGDACSNNLPPEVTLVAPKNNVVGTSFPVVVNVSGCAKVSSFEIQHNATTFKTPTYTGANSTIDITPGDLAGLYASVGIAANLNLTAQATCDDGRKNVSTPLGVRFFPVAEVVAPSMAQKIVLPDGFVAEGGVTGTPVSFVGCSNTSQGNALVRVDDRGTVLAINNSLPFSCDYYATISDKVAGGIRWLFQPNAGAFAFDQNLNVTGGISGDSLSVLSTVTDGDAIIWDSATGAAASIFRVGWNTGFGTRPKWKSNLSGIVNGEPVVDLSIGRVFIPTWRGAAVGATDVKQTVQYIPYETGSAPVDAERVLFSQKFDAFDTAVPPHVAFSPDGRSLYVVIPVLDNPKQTAVRACGAQPGGTGCEMRWQSPPLDGVIRFLVPFANGSKVAAISDQKVWFLEDSQATGGRVLNPGGKPTVASGTLPITGVQPGKGNDFYLLNGAPFPSEIIAIDNAQSGEVFRYSLGGNATSAQAGITVAVDDNGSPWLRIGVNRVKPLSLAEYRTARGPTQ